MGKFPLKPPISPLVNEGSWWWSLVSVQLHNLPTHFQKFRMDPAILKVYRILSKVVASTLVSGFFHVFLSRGVTSDGKTRTRTVSSSGFGTYWPCIISSVRLLSLRKCFYHIYAHVFFLVLLPCIHLRNFLAFLALSNGWTLLAC